MAFSTLASSDLVSTGPTKINANFTLVGGALVTVGAIPYTSATNALAIDATKFFWDSTNHRLGVGTNSPSYQIDVGGASATVAVQAASGNASLILKDGSATCQWNLAAQINGQWTLYDATNVLNPITVVPNNGGIILQAPTNLATSASGSTTVYTAPTTGLAAYVSGAHFFWKPDTNGAGGATTLNLNGLGAKAVKQADGSTNPTSSTIVSGHYYLLIYDGTLFRIIAGT